MDPWRKTTAPSPSAAAGAFRLAQQLENVSPTESFLTLVSPHLPAHTPLPNHFSLHPQDINTMNSEFQSLRGGGAVPPRTPATRNTPGGPGAAGTGRSTIPLPSPGAPGGVEASIRARLGLGSSAVVASPAAAPPASARGAAISSTLGSLARTGGALEVPYSPAARSRQLQGGGPASMSSPAASYFERLKEETASGGLRSGVTPSTVPPPHAAMAATVPVAAYMNEVDALKRSMAEASSEWDSTNKLVKKERDSLVAYSKDLEEKNRTCTKQLAVSRAVAILNRASTRRMYSAFTALRDAAVDAAMSNTFSLLDSERKKTSALQAQVSWSGGAVTWGGGDSALLFFSPAFFSLLSQPFL